MHQRSRTLALALETLLRGSRVASLPQRVRPFRVVSLPVFRRHSRMDCATGALGFKPLMSAFRAILLQNSNFATVDFFAEAACIPDNATVCPRGLLRASYSEISIFWPSPQLKSRQGRLRAQKFLIFAKNRVLQQNPPKNGCGCPHPSMSANGMSWPCSCPFQR